MQGRPFEVPEKADRNVLRDRRAGSGTGADVAADEYIGAGTPISAWLGFNLITAGGCIASTTLETASDDQTKSITISAAPCDSMEIWWDGEDYDTTGDGTTGSVKQSVDYEVSEDASGIRVGGSTNTVEFADHRGSDEVLFKLTVTDPNSGWPGEAAAVVSVRVRLNAGGCGESPVFAPGSGIPTTCHAQPGDGGSTTGGGPGACPGGGCGAPIHVPTFEHSDRVHVRLDVGWHEDQCSAGTIEIQSDGPTTDLYDRGSLIALVVDDADIDVVEYPSGKLRQVLTDVVLVDLVDRTGDGFDVKYYEASQVGTADGNGIYSVTGSPFKTWSFYDHKGNGDGEDFRVERQLTGGGDPYRRDYEWSSTSETWTQLEYEGTSLIWQLSYTTNESAGVTYFTNVVEDASEEVVYKEVRGYRSYDWGDELVEHVIDPDGAALTTTWTYDSLAVKPWRGKPRTITYPTGRKESYSYDSVEGRIAELKETWEDTDDELVTTYSYTPITGSDDDGDLISRPRTVTRKVGTTVVGITFYVYDGDFATEDLTVIEERAASQTASFGDTGNLRTTTVYHARDEASYMAGKIETRQFPDGRKDYYYYQPGTYTGSAPSSLPGSWSDTGSDHVMETVVHATSSSSSGVTGKTTTDVLIRDMDGKVLLKARCGCLGSVGSTSRLSYAMDYTFWEYDDRGRVETEYYANGLKRELDWSDCCGLEDETDRYGIVTSYDYNAAGQRIAETREGIGSEADIVTTNVYDAVGRLITQTVQGSTLSLVTSNSYDDAGRRVESIDPAGLTNEWSFASGGLVETNTLAGGATRVTTRYEDGRLKSVTGTAVVAKHYDYGVNTDGTQWTKVSTVSTNSAMWEKTTHDLLGRVKTVERPGYSGTETTTNTYDSAGRLQKVEAPGLAARLYGYDELGNVTTNCLDVSGGGINESSTDRITLTETVYLEDASDLWWTITTNQTYAVTNSSAKTTTSIEKRLMPVSVSGAVVEKAISIDIFGNETVHEVAANRSSAAVTNTVDHMDSTNDEVRVTVNGLLRSVETKAGVTHQYGYDALGRRTEEIDPRTGTNTTHYASTGRIDWVEDPAGNRTEFVYGSAGRLTQKTDANSNKVYYGHNDRGQVTNIWGDTPYPVQYAYGAYGRMTNMWTYRSGTSWDSATWPTGESGDSTTWMYQTSTGLLTNKQDAAGESVVYTYTNALRLATRTWARQDGTSDLVTTYTYSGDTGELAGIDYSDSATADIDFTYNRAGQIATVADAVGSRDPGVQRRSAGYLRGDHRRRRRAVQRDARKGVRGIHQHGAWPRRRGEHLECLLRRELRLRRARRLDEIVSTSTVSGTNEVFEYGYLANSHLIETLSETNSEFTVTRAYEDQRDLLTQIKTEFPDGRAART